MRISLQSQICFFTCVAVCAYNAYADPVKWISFLACGVLFGALSGRSDLQTVREGCRPGNNQGFGWDQRKDYEVRENAVKSLTKSMPGLLTTAINLLALGLLYQIVKLPSGWDPRIGTLFCDAAAMAFGWHVGMLLQLDILRKQYHHPLLQKHLKQAII